MLFPFQATLTPGLWEVTKSIPFSPPLLAPSFPTHVCLVKGAANIHAECKNWTAKFLPLYFLFLSVPNFLKTVQENIAVTCSSA